MWDISEHESEEEVYLTLREKCSNTEVFLVPIFPHSD